MKKIFLVVTIILFVLAGQAGAAGRSTFKAYVTIGNNTVALPSVMRPGDRLILTNVNGSTVYERKVTEGAFYMNLSFIHTGIYILKVERNRALVASMRLPLSGI
jgi:hypothetical protein